MASMIVKTGDHNPLNPTNIVYGNLTILQHTFLRLFPNTSSPYFQLLRVSPGEEIITFRRILGKYPSLVLRDDRGIAIAIKESMNPLNPPEDLTLAIIRSLAISYEEASRRSSVLKKAILDLPENHKVFYIQSTETSHTSFIYDGHKREGTQRLIKVKGNKNILNKALERAKEAILSEETMALAPLTPTEAQNSLVQFLSNSLKMDIVRDDDDWTMRLRLPLPLEKVYPYVYQINRGYIRATHPGMILPDTSPNQFVKYVESVGKKIAHRRIQTQDSMVGYELPTSAEMREYGAQEETLATDSTILPIPKANPYDMRSMYRFQRFRPKLMPVL